METTSELWAYMSEPQKDLIREGKFLMSAVSDKAPYTSFTDYSFVVFPFAKAYEGFLKKIFLDVGFISDSDYISPHFRLGKVLSPNLARKLGDYSVYQKIVALKGEKIAQLVWDTWKRGRNEIFHYFPHNIRSLTFAEAQDIISQLSGAMEDIFEALRDEIPS